MITIVDYGMGNPGSLLSMLKRIGAPACIASDADTLSRADKIILPGVGAFDAAMRRLNEAVELREVLETKALREKIPVLGVCLGMQLMTCSSEEGSLPGLNWISASARRFPKLDGLKVPHMGWNVAKPAASSGLTAGIAPDYRFYFVHSYYVQVDDPAHSLMRSTYGISFDSAIGAGNLYGVQFHPEKSHRYGMHLLRNFVEIPS